MKNGVPYDVAMSLDWMERRALYIIHAQFDGNQFDFDRMEFEKKQ